MSQLRSDEEFAIASEGELSPRLNYNASYTDKVPNPESKELSLYSVLPRNSAARKRKAPVKGRRSKAKVQVSEGDDPIICNPLPSVEREGGASYLPSKCNPRFIDETQTSLDDSPLAASANSPETSHTEGPLEALNHPPPTTHGSEGRRYPIRARNPDALCPFSKPKWLDWRTAVPDGTDLSILKEPIEGFDTLSHSSVAQESSEDGEFRPDEPEPIESQPVIPVNEYTSESEPDSSVDESASESERDSSVKESASKSEPDPSVDESASKSERDSSVNESASELEPNHPVAKRRKRGPRHAGLRRKSARDFRGPLNPPRTHPESLSAVDGRATGISEPSPTPTRTRNGSDAGSEGQSPIPTYTANDSDSGPRRLSPISSRAASPMLVVNRRRATQVIGSDSDEAKQTKAVRTYHSRKINFLTYYNTHIVPAYPLRASIPQFLRLCHRRYRMRARHPIARLVDYPWAKCIYSVSLKDRTCQRLPFRLPKSAHRQAVSARHRVGRRRARLFTPQKHRALLDFYHRLDMRDQRLYQRRQLDPDAFFYRFNEPGFPTKLGSQWAPKEEGWFHAHMRTYKANQWPLGTAHPRVHPAKGWGIFSIAIPTRTGQQCEQHYRTLVSRALIPPLPRNPSPTGTGSKSNGCGIPSRRSRPIAYKPRPPSIPQLVPNALLVLDDSDQSLGQLSGGALEPSAESVVAFDRPHLQATSALLMPQLTGGVYFDFGTYVGSGQLLELNRFASNPREELGRYSHDQLPALKVAGFLVDLKSEGASISESIEAWGRWLLKKITTLDLSSSGGLAEEVASIFLAYRHLLGCSEAAPTLIYDQLVTVETFLPALHHRLQSQLLGPIKEVLTLHTLVLDWLARHQLLFANSAHASRFFSCLAHFGDCLVRYAVAFATCNPHRPLTHPVVEGFQVLRAMLSTVPKPPPVGGFDSGADTFWGVINLAFRSGNLQNVEDLWRGLSVILTSTAPNHHGVFPAAPPNPSQVPPNWELFTLVLSWATSSHPLPPNEAVPSGEVTAGLTALPKPKDRDMYVHELLVRAAIVAHAWHWPLTQELLCALYDHLKDFCPASAAPQLPGFLIVGSGAVLVPSLASILLAPADYSPFEVFLSLVSSYVVHVVSDGDARLALNTVEKLQSKLSPTRKLTFEDPAPENLCVLVNFIAVRLVLIRALPFTVKPLDKQMRSFILRLRQLVDRWDKLDAPPLLTIVGGFFAGLRIAIERLNELPGSQDLPLLTQDGLAFVAEIARASEGAPALAAQFQTLMQELVARLLPLNGPKPLLDDAFALFSDAAGIFDAISPYTCSPVQAAAVGILDCFLGRLTCLLAPPPCRAPVEGGVGVDDFDDFEAEDFELMAHQPSVAPAPQTASVPLLLTVARFFYGKRAHLRLMAILCSCRDTNRVSDPAPAPTLILRSAVLLARICHAYQMPALEEFGGPAPASTYPRPALVDRAWLGMALLDRPLWPDSFLRSAALLWAHTISDPVTRRHELLAQCLAWSASAACAGPLTHFFNGASWRALPHLGDTKELLVLNPTLLDARWLPLTLLRQGLVSDAVAGMGCLSTLPPVERPGFMSLCQEVLVSLLGGVRYNVDRERKESGSTPDLSKDLSHFANWVVDAVFEALAALTRHGPFDDAIEALLPLATGGLLWTSLTYGSLQLRLLRFRSLDYARNANLQQLLWFWFRSLVIQDLELPHPLLPEAPLSQVAALFLPAVTEREGWSWDGLRGGLPAYLYATVIGPILRSPLGSWHGPTLGFLDILLKRILEELVGCLARPRRFELACSPIQAELDPLLHSLHHLALVDPQAWLVNPGLEAYLRVVATLAELSALVKRGNRAFFDSNLAWFEKVELILSTALVNLHLFWLRRIRENGHLNLTLPSPHHNLLTGACQRTSSSAGSSVEGSWVEYCQDAQALLENSRLRVMASAAPPSIVPVLPPRPISPPRCERTIEQLVGTSARLLQALLPVWRAASHLAAPPSAIVWRFLAAPSQHPAHLPHFFLILGRVLDRLPSGAGGPRAQLQDILLNMGSRHAALLGWYQFSLRSLPLSLRPTHRANAPASQRRSSAFLRASPLLSTHMGWAGVLIQAGNRRQQRVYLCAVLRPSLLTDLAFNGRSLVPIKLMPYPTRTPCQLLKRLGIEAA
ncbi:hypothetical protein L0F63_002100 [Massospora cicadina]|nr:hypothetical protein L0F63_002100 [Massospora cicadina]